MISNSPWPFAVGFASTLMNFPLLLAAVIANCGWLNSVTFIDTFPPADFCTVPKASESGVKNKSSRATQETFSTTSSGTGFKNGTVTVTLLWLFRW